MRFTFAQMGGAEFKDWMARCGLSIRTAADALGLHKRTVVRYSQGHTQVPPSIALLCGAVEDKMAYSKLIPMQKRRAMGETITGSKKDAEGNPMKKGGKAKVHPYHGKPMNKGGKAC